METQLRRVIPSEWQGAIDRLNTLPDQRWRSDCRTDEQKQHWDDCKLFCLFIRKLLKDYFSGVATDLSQLPKDDRTFWLLYRDRWVSLYNVIQHAWIEIHQAVVNDKLEAYFPSQPGEMLIAILEMWAAGMFAPCVIGIHPELGRFSPRKEYTTYRNQFKPLVLPEGVTLHDWRKRFSKADREKMTFFFHETYCLLVCKRAAKQDRLLKRKLSEFGRIESELDQSLYATIHPRKKVKGCQWINGRKAPAV